MLKSPLRLFAYVRELERRAFYDELTGVLRRWRFFDLLSHAVARAQNSSEYHVALYYVDLDGFKAVNDTYGHGVGDKYLCFVAQKIAEFVKKARGVVLGRMGGDEFALFQMVWDGHLNYLQSENARRIHDHLVGLVYHHSPDIVIRCSASVGYATTKETVFDPDILIAAADKKMFAAKRRVRRERR